MFQAQLTQIDNGFLVITAPKPQAIRTASQTQQQPQPTTTYCRDFVEVFEALKAEWPIEVV